MAHKNEPVINQQDIADLLDTVGIISLVSGETEHGETFWAYVSVPTSKYDDFLQVQEQGDYNLNDWGTILCHGQGDTPPPEIMTKMEEDFGLTHNI